MCDAVRAVCMYYPWYIYGQYCTCCYGISCNAKITLFDGFQRYAPRACTRLPLRKEGGEGQEVREHVNPQSEHKASIGGEVSRLTLSGLRAMLCKALQLLSLCSSCCRWLMLSVVWPPGNAMQSPSAAASV